MKRYYDWLLNGPHEAYAIGMECDGRLVGLCFGGQFRGALSGYLRANRWFLAIRAILRPWVFTKRIVRDRLRLGLRLLRRHRAIPTTGRPARSFGILAIAVAPRYHGRKIGYSMLRSSEEYAYLHGWRHMHLTVEPATATQLRSTNAWGG